MVRAYELLSERGDWPLHLGVTEAGPAFQGTIKSATAFGALLAEGIGDTIRVSLSAPPVEEVKVGIQILQSLNLRPRKLEIVSCPSCGRAQVDVYTLAEKVTAGLEGMTSRSRSICLAKTLGETPRNCSASPAPSSAVYSRYGAPNQNPRVDEGVASLIARTVAGSGTDCAIFTPVARSTSFEVRGSQHPSHRPQSSTLR